MVPPLFPRVQSQHPGSLWESHSDEFGQMCKDLWPLWPLCFMKTDATALGEPSTCLSPSTANHTVTGGNFWISREKDIGGLSQDLDY